MNDNNSNFSSKETEPEPRKKASDKNYTQY